MSVDIISVSRQTNSTHKKKYNEIINPISEIFYKTFLKKKKNLHNKKMKKKWEKQINKVKKRKSENEHDGKITTTTAKKIIFSVFVVVVEKIKSIENDYNTTRE